MRFVLPAVDTPTGIEVARSDLRPAPVDPEAWQRRVLGLDTPGVEVRSTERTETTAGWPVTLIRSDDAAGARRLHAFYTLVDRCCVVTVTGRDDDALASMRSVLLAADVDWTSNELLAVVQLWEA